MNVKALPMTDLLKECDDIYRTAMIISQRSRQIIDDRVMPIDETEEVEDSIQFAELEIVEDDLDDNVDKAMSDASTQWPLDQLEPVLVSMLAFRETYLHHGDKNG